MQVLVELVRARACDQRHLGAFRHLARDQGQRAGKAAMDRRQFIARYQPVGFGAGHRGVALHVGDDQIEFCPAERLDAAGLVDHVDREFCRGDAADADLGHAAGGRVECADIDGIGGPAAQRHRAEGAGRDRAAGLQQEFAAALPLRQDLRGGVFAVQDGCLAIFFHIVSP